MAEVVDLDKFKKRREKLDKMTGKVYPLERKLSFDEELVSPLPADEGLDRSHK